MMKDKKKLTNLGNLGSLVALYSQYVLSINSGLSG